MEQNKVDRRTRKTRKALIEALTKLMSEKKINKITVKELTDLADVNRSTFYLYYNDIYDMLEKSRQDYSMILLRLMTNFQKKQPPMIIYYRF